jgi:predicted heme/steroid binding protein
MIAIAYEGSVYHSSLYGGCDGLTSNCTYEQGKSISSKWSLIVIIYLLPSIPYLWPRTRTQIAITQSKMIAIAYEGSVYHSSLYGQWDGLTSPCSYS